MRTMQADGAAVGMAGENVIVWSLTIAGGIDPLLMVAYCVLNEKDSSTQHYVPVRGA